METDPQASPLPEASRIGGLRRRCAAYLLDCVLLAVLGHGIAFYCFDRLAQLGPWGLAGVLIPILYFGMGTSTLGEGSTPGQKLLKIKVVDRNGGHLSPARSLLRCVIFYAPVLACSFSYACGAPLSLVGYFGLGLGGVFLYLYLFNRRTRQSLHDWATQAYVVRDSPAGPVQAPPAWKGHLAIAGLWLLLSGAGIAALQHFAAQSGLLSPREGARQAILASGQVFQAAVVELNLRPLFHRPLMGGRVLIAVAWWKKRPLHYEDCAAEVASLVLKNDPHAFESDRLSVTILYGYNIQFSSHWIKRRFVDGPWKWNWLLEKRRGRQRPPEVYPDTPSAAEAPQSLSGE